MRLSEAYQILGISAAAGDQEVRKAFAALSRKYHPEEAPEEYQRIYEAYRMVIEERRDRQRAGFRTDTDKPTTDPQAAPSQPKAEADPTGVFADTNERSKAASETEPSQTKAGDAVVWENAVRNKQNPETDSSDQNDGRKHRAAQSNKDHHASVKTGTVPPEVQARLASKKKQKEQRLSGTAAAVFLIVIMFYRVSLSTPSSQQVYLFPFFLLVAAVMLLFKLFRISALSPFMGGLSGLIYCLCVYLWTDFSGLEEAIMQGSQVQYANEIAQRAQQMKMAALAGQLETFRLILFVGLLFSGGLVLLSLPFLIHQLLTRRTSLRYWEKRQYSVNRILRRGRQLDSLPPKLPDQSFSGLAYTLDEDQRIIQYGRYTKGVLHGGRMELDTYGLLQKVSVFSKGQPRFETQWYPGGNLMEFIRFRSSGKQKRQLYAEDGTLVYSNREE